jgi:hypothetical protein
VNTKGLMVASSVALGLAGAAASFAPDEILAGLTAPTVAPLPVFVQLLGALYLAFAIANWTAKDNIIGGIYSRPLSLGNFLHFVMGALALLKYVQANGFSLSLGVAVMVYTVFAIGFGYLVFGLGAASRVTARER